MGKIQYVTGQGADRKLKRNVPKELAAIAERTAWIERVAHLPHYELKQRANLFAVRTDAEIAALRRLLTEPSVPADQAPLLSLDDATAQRLALVYFQERDQANIDSGDYFGDPDHPDYHDLLTTAYEDGEEARLAASGEVRRTEVRAIEILTQSGLLSEKAKTRLLASGWPRVLDSHRPFKSFCRMIERADVQLADRRIRALETGKAPIIAYNLRSGESPPIDTPLRNKEASSKRHTIQELIRDFTERHATSVTPSRASQYNSAFRVLQELLGPDIALDRITREQARDVVYFLPRIPSYAKQHYKGLSLVQAAEKYEERTGNPANRWEEAQKTLQVIRMVFGHGVDEGWVSANPFGNRTITLPNAARKKHDAQKGYEPFTFEELNRFFQLPLYTGCVDDEYGCHTPGPKIIRRHRFWAPLLSLFGGLRMNEILQLEKEDFEVSSNGTPFLRITDRVHGTYPDGEFEKRLKTKNALRDVPVHPFLVEAGLVDWINSTGNGRLFPEASKGSSEKPSDVYSKRFRTNLKRAGIWTTRRKVFHSFRNNFNDALREADVPVDIREAINGWQAQAAMDSRYGKGHKIDRLNSELSKVRYPKLQMDHVIASGNEPQ